MTVVADIAGAWMTEAGRRAKSAAAVLAIAPAAQRNRALTGAARQIRAGAAAIAAANEADLAASTAGPAFRDRLTLTPARIEAMAAGLDEMAALPDPLDRVLAEWTRPNGLRFQRVAAPVGVIGMIYGN